ncbi:ferredoxin [Vagococcus sp. PNs007]|uniref:Ferredoxin n=1 Tax=Vagococcus proximus TaxID=2991417 RepID=A0ABT5X1T5_9ENTE|nr:ferredoxin [Vagococcus proximus]MDF0479960.1 ferredoxin [Vagococcus proximus]
MKLSIVPEKCIACGLCQVLAPTIFDYTDNGIVLFKDNPNTLSLELEAENLTGHDAMAAYKECPTRAIIIEKQK